MAILSSNGKVMAIGGTTIKVNRVDPYNPLNLPPFTIRVRYLDGTEPTVSATVSRYSYNPDIFDIYLNSPIWDSLFLNESNLMKVLGANTTQVTSMQYMFRHCTSLDSVGLFDTSNVTSMYFMFNDCMSLTSIPLLNTSSAVSMSYMFMDCRNVGSGMLDIYNQASTQDTPPQNHSDVFWYCGMNTETGRAELAQIPTSWGGTKVE